MHRDDVLGLQHLRGAQRVVRPHRVIVADGQDSQIQPLFADQPHIAEQAGVAGEINLFALGRKQKPARVAAVGAIRQAGAVQRERELEIAEGMVVPTAQVLRVRLRALRLGPVADFKIADDRRPRAFGDGDGVRDVVAVAVRDQNEIGLRLLGGDGGGGVPGEERINQQLLSARFHQTGAVAVPGVFEGHTDLLWGES